MRHRPKSYNWYGGAALRYGIFSINISDKTILSQRRRKVRGADADGGLVKRSMRGVCVLAMTGNCAAISPHCSPFANPVRDVAGCGAGYQTTLCTAKVVIFDVTAKGSGSYQKGGAKDARAFRKLFVCSKTTFELVTC